MPVNHLAVSVFAGVRNCIPHLLSYLLLSMYYCIDREANDILSVIQHFLRKEAVPCPEFEAKLYQSILPQISAAEVSQYCEKLYMSKSSVTVTIEPRATVTVEPSKPCIGDRFSGEGRQN
ncbi:hypothetical protein KSS87_011921 [Heliosperma pusillum]|nr:hypothetical protein KSS87_011921 [Heliosperma pusillum]